MGRTCVFPGLQRRFCRVAGLRTAAAPGHFGSRDGDHQGWLLQQLPLLLWSDSEQKKEEEEGGWLSRGCVGCPTLALQGKPQLNI